MNKDNYDYAVFGVISTELAPLNDGAGCGKGAEKTVSALAFAVFVKKTHSTVQAADNPLHYYKLLRSYAGQKRGEYYEN